MRHRIILLLPAVFVFALAIEALGEVPDPVRTVVQRFCVDCHDADEPEGGRALASVRSGNPSEHPEVWEKVVRRLQRRQMPPAGKERPDEQTYAAVLSQLETALDRAAAERPNPGRTDTIRRLTRTEYQNA